MAQGFQPTFVKLVRIYNLRARPDNGQIQIAGQTIAVSAEQLSGNCRSSACEPDPTSSRRFQDANTTARPQFVRNG